MKNLTVRKERSLAFGAPAATSAHEFLVEHQVMS